MDYSQQIGLGREAKEQFSVEEKEELDLSDLQIGNYFRFLRWYSKERGPLLGASRESYGRRQSYQEIEGWGYSRHLEAVLSVLFSPLQDKRKILERQNIIKYFIEDSEDRKATRNLVREIFDIESELYQELCERDRRERGLAGLDKRVLPQFADLINLLRIFQEAHSSDILKYFASNINGVLRKNQVAKRAEFLRGEITLVVGEQSRKDGRRFYLTKATPGSSFVFDLGLFEQGKETKIHYYPGDINDANDIVSFVRAVSTPIFFLSAFLYQAEVFRNMRVQGIPVCLPNINDQGLFSVRNASPLTTYLVEAPKPFSFSYDRTNRKFLFGGAHSGGKSELIKNIGGFHAVGLGGGIIPCEEGAEIPLTRRIVTSFRKAKQRDKGSLESEVQEVLKIERKSRETDLLLIDEFLDTTKPELAMHIVDPLLGGLEGVCRGLANTPATVFIVDHRASRMKKDFGFKFMYPILTEAEELEEVHLRGDDYQPRQDQDSDDINPKQVIKKPTEQRPRKMILVPTHEFGSGKPNPHDVRRHALQMWERVKKKVFGREKRRSGCYILNEEIATYGIFEPQEPGFQKVSASKEEAAWQDWRELKEEDVFKETISSSSKPKSIKGRRIYERIIKPEEPSEAQEPEKPTQPEEKRWIDEEDILPF